MIMSSTFLSSILVASVLFLAATSPAAMAQTTPSVGSFNITYMNHIVDFLAVTDEIKMEYQIGKGPDDDAGIVVNLSNNCTAMAPITPLGASVITQKNRTITVGDRDNLYVTIDLNKTMLKASNIWAKVDNVEVVELCVLLQLWSKSGGHLMNEE